MAQITKPGTTILNLGAPAQFGAKPVTSSGFVRELHALPPSNVTGAQLGTPDDIARAINENHEAVRRATQSVRQDPGSAPCYVRGVSFKNTGANAANITVTIPHTLGRPHTILHVTRSQGAAYSGFETNATNTHVTITAAVPGSTTAIHDFKLAAD